MQSYQLGDRQAARVKSALTKQSRSQGRTIDHAAPRPEGRKVTIAEKLDAAADQANERVKPGSAKWAVPSTGTAGPPTSRCPA